MNKIKISLYNFADRVSKKHKKVFLWLAGFRNIKNLEITCKHGPYLDTFTMREDGVIHTVVNLKIVIDDKV